MIKFEHQPEKNKNLLIVDLKNFENMTGVFGIPAPSTTFGLQ